MDERLKHALDMSKRRQTFDTQLNILKAKHKQYLCYSINGGTFQITPDLICYVDLMLRRNQENAVLIDMRGNPILIENIELFLENIISRQADVNYDFYMEYQKIRSSCKIDEMVNLNDIER